jgi:hypothetical protein
MDKMMEFIDTFMRSQKEFMESWVTAQKEFMEKWIETTRRMQESVISMGGSQEGASEETLKLYGSWTSAAADALKAFTSEAGKIQETWKDTVEKQMDMTNEMVKNFQGFFKKAA